MTHRAPFAAVLATLVLTGQHAAAQDTLPCKMDQRFFVAADVSATDYTVCPEDRDIGDGAEISFSRDNIADTSTGTFRLSLGYLIVSPLDPRGSRRGFERLGFSDVALLGYFSADGEIYSDGTSAGMTRLGMSLVTKWETGVETITEHRVSLAAHALSDMRFRASGYGLSLGYIPVSPLRHLNTFLNTTRNVDYRLNLRPRLDAFHVDDPGETGLDAATDYLWVGADLGVDLRLRVAGLPQPVTAGVGVSAYHDLVSDIDAVLYQASLSMPIDEKGRASIALTYDKGRDRSLREQDALRLALSFRF